MNVKLVFKVLGHILRIESVFLLLPAMVALVYGESPLPFLVTALLLLGVGQGLCRLKTSPHFFTREGFVAVGLIWFATCLFGALPFWLSGSFPSFVDCVFESASGFTTTGASILTDIEAMPKGVLFWRSFTHWLGGMGVLVLATAVLPSMGIRSHYLTQAETPGPVFSKLVPKQSTTSKILYSIYFGLTVVETVLLKIAGMPWYDAVIHALSSAGTGGFSNRNASVGAYNSAYIDIVTGIGMLAFGVNFNLYYFLLIRRFRDVAKSEELWAYLGIVAFSTVTIAANIRHLYGAVGTSLRHAFFQVSSIITTTGYATVDFDQWPGYAKTVLVLLMFVGGCAGSTGGGLKVTRVVTLVKAAFMDMRKMLHPNAVVNVRMEGRAMPEKQVRGVQAYFSVYMLLYAVSWLLLSLNGFDLLSTFTALSACINNIGPGLGMVGPTGNFSAFAPWAKLLLSFDMLAGRLEIFPMLLLFVPSTWRGNRLRRWERRN